MKSCEIMQTENPECFWQENKPGDKRKIMRPSMHPFQRSNPSQVNLFGEKTARCCKHSLRSSTILSSEKRTLKLLLLGTQGLAMRLREISQYLSQVVAGKLPMNQDNESKTVPKFFTRHISIVFPSWFPYLFSACLITLIDFQEIIYQLQEIFNLMPDQVRQTAT